MDFLPSGHMSSHSSRIFCAVFHIKFDCRAHSGARMMLSNQWIVAMETAGDADLRTLCRKQVRMSDLQRQLASSV